MKKLIVSLLTITLLFAVLGHVSEAAHPGEEEFFQGMQYYEGNSVKKDYTLTIKWLKQAVDADITMTELASFPLNAYAMLGIACI
jgi:TPR repeat protein